MQWRLLKISTYILVAVCFAACNLVENQTIDPSYLNISELSLVTQIKEGANTHKISSIRVFLDNQELGVFSLPAKVPIIVNEPREYEVRVTAGISPNGSSGNSLEYPFYAPNIKSIFLEPNKNYDHPLVFTIAPLTKIDFIEDFEIDNTFSVDLDNNENTSLNRSNLQSKSGQFSGEIILNKENPSIDVTTFVSFSNTNNQQGAVFLEFDYKCNIDVFCGAYLQTNNSFIKQYTVGLRPQPDWNKTYIDLTNEISNSEIVNYRAIFGAIWDEAFGVETAEIYLDNVKLLHF